MISWDLDHLVANVFRMYQQEYFTVAPVDKHA